jgi:23S rRNA G2069 N7-methylase RlmK/C1962 C5-methylase RlmI
LASCCRRRHPGAQRSARAHARRLEQIVEIVSGTIPETVVVREGPIEYDVDLRKGQKTGLFLDQRENREGRARYARGRLLDWLQLSRRLRTAAGAASAPRSKRSTSAPTPCARIQTNAERNHVTNLRAREANVFDELRHYERAGARYDTIVLDPPAFAKNKASVPNALAGYKEINLARCACSSRRAPDHVQLLLQRQRRDVRAMLHEASSTRTTAGDDRRKADAGARHPVSRRGAGNAYLKVLHPAASRIQLVALSGYLRTCRARLLSLLPLLPTLIIRLTRAA